MYTSRQVAINILRLPQNENIFKQDKESMERLCCYVYLAQATHFGNKDTLLIDDTFGVGAFCPAFTEDILLNYENEIYPEKKVPELDKDTARLLKNLSTLLQDYPTEDLVYVTHKHTLDTLPAIREDEIYVIDFKKEKERFELAFKGKDPAQPEDFGNILYTSESNRHAQNILIPKSNEEETEILETGRKFLTAEKQWTTAMEKKYQELLNRLNKK